MNENFAAQIATRLDEALAAFRETGSEYEEGLAHGYSLVQNHSIEGLPALAVGADRVNFEADTDFSRGVSFATSHALQILNMISKEA